MLFLGTQFCSCYIKICYIYGVSRYVGLQKTPKDRGFQTSFPLFWDSGFSCKYVLCCRWADCAALDVSVSQTNRVIKFGRSGCWLNTVRCLRWPTVVASGHQVGSWPPTATRSVANLGHLIGLPPPWASKSTCLIAFQIGDEIGTTLFANKLLWHIFWLRLP